MFVLCLEVFQEVIETCVFFCHGLNTGVQRLTRVRFLSFDEVLKLLNFHDGLGSRLFHLETFLISFAEEEHTCLLVLIGVRVGEDS